MKTIQRHTPAWAAGLAVFAIAVAPIGASAVTDTTTVSVTVDSSISVSSSGATSLGSVTPGGAAATGTNTVTVDNNDVDGYTLSIQSTDTTATLDGPSGNTIAPSSGTPVAPVALADDTWGYRLSGYAAGAYAGMTNTPVQIVDKTGVVTNDQTVVTYATKVSTSKAAGTYTDSVTYTALVK